MRYYCNDTAHTHVEYVRLPTGYLCRAQFYCFQNCYSDLTIPI